MEYKKTPVRRIWKFDRICRICNDVARGYNFDVITCMSCKAFFRRNAVQFSKIWQCQGTNNCHITKETRGTCASCRLRKCYAYGMNPRLIRLRNPNAADSNTSDQLMTTVQLPAPKPLSLLRNDCSTLTKDQWNLLSNVIRSYDEQNIINLARDMLAEKSALPPKLRLKSKDTIDFISQLQTNFILFLKRSPNLRHLSTNGHQALISHNLFFISSLNTGFVAHETNAYKDTTYMSACSALFGSELMMKCAEERYLTNGNLYKILLFVLIFSSNCSIIEFNHEANVKTVSSSSELMQVQDVYVTMFWKYLVYVYGYYGAAMRFTIMIKNVLDGFIRMEDAMKSAAYVTILEKFSTFVERFLVLND